MCTPSDAFSAIRAGADGLKIFPAEMVTPAVLKAFHAVLPKGLPILPTGSITPRLMPAFLEAGATGFGLGSVAYRRGDSPSIVKQKAHDIVAAFKELQ